MTDNTALRAAGCQREAGAKTALGRLEVQSPGVEYSDAFISSRYRYSRVTASVDDAGNVTATPIERFYRFRTEKCVEKMGLLQVGWGGNNGTTLTAAIIANKLGIEWETRTGMQKPNFNGSLTQAATMRVGFDANGKDVFVPFSSVLPMVSPEDIALGGWDISGMNLADAMDRAQVLEPDLRRKLRPHMEKLVPMRGIFYEDYIAKNQAARNTNDVEEKDKGSNIWTLRENIRNFKARHKVKTTVVVWTGNSEKYSKVTVGVNDTADNLMDAILNSHPDVSPSTLYAAASILEGCPYINGSPQNTFVPGILELAEQRGILICGDDFKSGQTKMKSVLADYLISCGVKIKTMVTYNHLGNNDMYQLTDEVMWKPKSASKTRVIEDIVDANGLLYPPGEPGPDHVVTVKYVPYLGDSKRDVSEYTSETFMGCKYTTVMHNTCLDSALCAPLILDLAILAELFSRVKYTVEKPDGAVVEEDYRNMESALSVLGFYMKIPQTPGGEPIVNALARQKACLENMLRALVGLPPENHLLLEKKCPEKTTAMEM